jgi:hypothetical protein
MLVKVGGCASVAGEAGRWTRHDCAAPAAAECKIRRPARACRAWVAYGNLQPLTLPDTLDPLVVDYPARLAQELASIPCHPSCQPALGSK